jgi:phage terminase small subunit
MASRKKNTPAVQQTSPVVESEQTCQVEKVECPPELGPIAREEWDKVAPHLVAGGRLKPPDRSSLAVYCAAYPTWLEASQTVRSWQAFTGRQGSVACSAALPYSGAPSGRRHCHR